MNLFRATFTALILISFLLTSESAVAQKRDTVVEKFAEALGDLLREAVGEKKKAVPAQRIRQMAQPALPEPAPDQIKRRERRLTAYSNAMVEWVATACELSDEETATLGKFAKERVAIKQQEWKPDPNQNPLHDTFPVKFTLAMGMAERLDLTRQQRKLNGILKEEQLDRLSEAADERNAFHLDATVEQVLNLLDEELFLTAAQRKEMYQPLRERLDGMERSAFTFTPQTYYYKQQSVAFLLRRGDHLKCLNAAQRARAKDFSGTTSRQNNGVNSEQYLQFSSSEGMHTWDEKLLEASKAQRERVGRACAVRAAYGQAEWGLSDEDARHLKIAGKGVAKNLIEAWKKTTRQQLKTYEEQAGRFGGNFSFAVQVPDLHAIESDAMWKHTVESLLADADEPASTRDAARRRSRAIHLTALLDKELWLRPEQRSKVQALIQECLPSGKVQGAYNNYMKDVASLVIPLFKFSKQDATVFVGAQKEAWETLKSEFDFNGRYAQVHLANGGNFHFQIPK